MMLSAVFAGKLVISWSGVLTSQELPSENENKILCLAPRNIEFVFSQARSTKWSWEKIKTITRFVFHYEANNSLFVQQELVKSLCVIVMLKYNYANSMITVLTYLQRISRFFFRIVHFLTTFTFSVKVYSVQFKSFLYFA